MRRFVPFVFVSIALFLMIRVFTTMDSGARLRAKLGNVDWRALVERCDEALETSEVTS